MKRVLFLLFLFTALGPAQSLRKIGAIDLPGPKGQRFDYLTMDDEDHYLLSAHLGPGILYVIDVRTNALVKAIPGVPGITGLEYVPGLHKVYTSDWGEEKIGVVDLRSMQVVKRLPTGEKPNGSAYATSFRKVYVSDTNGKAVAIVNVDKDQIVKTLQFKSETGMPQYDSVAKKIYVNLRSTNEIAEIDPATDTIVGQYPVDGCQYNHGMAMDSEHHRAFLLCGGNRTMTVFALDKRTAIAHLPIPRGADVIKFDSGNGRIYAACSSGFIAVFQEVDADHFKKLEDFPVQNLVHSLAVDTATHRVYAPEQQEDGKPVARMIIYEPGNVGPLHGATDPAVRPGTVNVGGAVAGVDAKNFVKARAAFNEVHSIAGDIEPGSGLGPRFNGTSCGGCHAYPAPGGSSPKQNPQLAMASAHGAMNVIPAFVKSGGPILVVRMKSRAGEVAQLLTVSGRSDAYGCAMKQPDFNDAADMSFRIPIPLFGDGLIENISLATILANARAHSEEKLALGISGRANIGSDGTVGKFGWKAQHPSLASFAADAYQTEMGVPVEASRYRRTSLSKACYAVYESAYDDPNFSPAYADDPAGSVVLFTDFMQSLAAPAAVREFAGAPVKSIRDGRRSFDRVGCALCHTQSLRTGGDSDLAALNGRDAQLFSDLLLHHMGTKLADGIVQGRAGPDEFRTAPLWGLGQRVFFLHDGRTSDLLRAIEEHASAGSEANRAIERFGQLSAAEQQDVLNFLRSL